MTESRADTRRSNGRPRRLIKAAIGTLVVAVIGVAAWAAIFAVASDDTSGTGDRIVLGICILVLSFLTLFVIAWLRSRGTKRRYVRLQRTRSQITDEEFCRRAGIDAAATSLVASIRNALADRGDGLYDAARIYPDDDFFTFELTYDEEIDWFVERARLIPGFHPDSSAIPVEEVTSVADFARVMHRMKGAAESPAILGSMTQRRVDKPWGYERIWAQTDSYVGKILVINAGKRLSLQFHEVKDETILVLSGRLLLHIDDGTGAIVEREMTTGESCHIAPGIVHRYEAIETTELAEVSTTQLDDVVRLEDDFGRQGTSEA